MKQCILLMALVFGALITGFAQQDPVGEHLFPPELILAHQYEIDLSADQKAAIKSLVKVAQKEFIDLEWELEDQATAFFEMIAKANIEEAQTLQQLEKVLDLENKIKRKQLTLMIKLKNLLSPAQQNQLDNFRG
ncbi:MAG: hypothetical protein AAFV80_15515 [Bacteroidota bacterium]